MTRQEIGHCWRFPQYSLAIYALTGWVSLILGSLTVVESPLFGLG